MKFTILLFLLFLKFIIPAYHFVVSSISIRFLQVILRKHWRNFWPKALRDLLRGRNGQFPKYNTHSMKFTILLSLLFLKFIIPAYHFVVSSISIRFFQVILRKNKKLSGASFQCPRPQRFLNVHFICTISISVHFLMTIGCWNNNRFRI